MGESSNSFIDGWESTQGSSDVYRWRVDEDGTPSSSTGPSVDHTLGNSEGNYFYTEASNYSTGDVAELISPCIDVPSNSLFPELSFYYHMYGSGIDILHIDVNTGSGWINSIDSISGPQHNDHSDPWLEKTVELSTYVGNAFQIRFRAIRGSSWRGDIAIDDIKFSENIPCEFVYSSSDSGEGTLRNASGCESAGSEPIQFNSGMDTIVLNSPLLINEDMTIQANLTDNIVISASGNFPIFDIRSGVSLSIENITLSTQSEESAVIFEDNTSTISIDGVVSIKNY